VPCACQPHDGPGPYFSVLSTPGGRASLPTCEMFVLNVPQCRPTGGGGRWLLVAGRRWPRGACWWPVQTDPGPGAWAGGGARSRPGRVGGGMRTSAGRWPGSRGRAADQIYWAGRRAVIYQASRFGRPGHGPTRERLPVCLCIGARRGERPHLPRWACPVGCDPAGVGHQLTQCGRGSLPKQRTSDQVDRTKPTGEEPRYCK